MNVDTLGVFTLGHAWIFQPLVGGFSSGPLQYIAGHYHVYTTLLSFTLVATAALLLLMLFSSTAAADAVVEKHTKPLQPPASS